MRLIARRFDRMSTSSRLLIATLIGVTSAWAQNQIATVTSSAPFTLRGAPVTPGQGVPTWPILAGDTVNAGTAITIVTFPDGSVLELAPGAEAKVDIVNGKPVVQLLSGSARYSLKSTSAVQLMEASQTVTPKNLVGILSVGNTRPAAAAAGSTGTSWWTFGHTALVIAGAAAAAGIGYGISQATQGGASVSPSQ
jgi:hypothetical protein